MDEEPHHAARGAPTPGRGRLDAAFAASLHAWLPPERRYLAAVSGGLDSMAMLDFLHGQGYRALTVCHVNHGLRGAESDGDEAFVRAAAERLGLPCECARVEVREHAEATGASLETAARELRYAALTEMAARLDCPRVLLAHHADDQVETVLIRLFRGAGSRGLSGMARRTLRRAGGVELELIRPFLGISREALERYAPERGLAFREDSSNAEDFALRNRVRRRLLPVLGEVFGRDVRGAVLRAAELARLDEEWAASAAGALPAAPGGGLDARALAALPEAQGNRLLLRWLREAGVPDCGYAEVRAAAEVARSRSRPAKANLPGGWHVRRRAGTLFLEPPAGGGAPEPGVAKGPQVPK